MVLNETENIVEIVFDYISKIEGVKKIDGVLMLLAEMAVKLVSADRCTLWVLDKTTNELWTRVSHGLEKTSIPATSGIVGYSVATGEVAIVNDPYNDPRFNQDVDKKSGYRTESILVIPIKNSSGEVLGAFQTINKISDDRKFTEADVKFLRLASTYAGEALETAMLYEEIEDTQRELIFTLSEIAEMRSKETGNHVKRVAEYSKLLALKYCMPKKQAELLKLASPMHDIGKIAIPDSILNKPGKLLPEEFDIMKKHTAYGYSMLKKSSRIILKTAAIVASQHHEKYDGSGYPEGLKGEEIHIFGRISAIADVFDALGSDRVYKKAWDMEKIIALFHEERGRHFDPKLIDIFFENISDFLAIKESFRDI